ncbi:hypothetical protein Tco_0143852, partial [Tanacetum coccineum]
SSQKCIDEELKGDPTGAASPNERITLNLSEAEPVGWLAGAQPPLTGLD